MATSQTCQNHSRSFQKETSVLKKESQQSTLPHHKRTSKRLLLPSQTSPTRQSSNLWALKCKNSPVTMDQPAQLEPPSFLTLTCRECLGTWMQSLWRRSPEFATSSMLTSSMMRLRESIQGREGYRYAWTLVRLPNKCRKISSMQALKFKLIRLRLVRRPPSPRKISKILSTSSQRKVLGPPEPTGRPRPPRSPRQIQSDGNE